MGTQNSDTAGQIVYGFNNSSGWGINSQESTVVKKEDIHSGLR